MYKRILVASDGSPGAHKAFEAALRLAKEHAAELHMISVEELSSFPASVDEVIEEKAEADHVFAPMIAVAQRHAKKAEVPFRAHVVAGHVAERVVAFIKEHGIELLVVGFMGHSRLYDRIIGSTTDRLVRLAPCAILVVK